MSIKPHAPALVAAGALLLSTTAAVVYTHRLQSLTAAIVAENVSSLRAAKELEFALRDIRGALYRHASESCSRGILVGGVTPRKSYRPGAGWRKPRRLAALRETAR